MLIDFENFILSATFIVVVPKAPTLLDTGLVGLCWSLSPHNSKAISIFLILYMRKLKAQKTEFICQGVSDPEVNQRVSMPSRSLLEGQRITIWWAKFSREGMPESRGQVEYTGEGFPEGVTHFCDQEGVHHIQIRVFGGSSQVKVIIHTKSWNISSSLPSTHIT